MQSPADSAAAAKVATNAATDGAKKAGLIDKDSFSREIHLFAINIEAKLTKEYMTAFMGHMFKMPKIRSVYDVPNEPTRRHLLLAETVTDKELSTLPPACAAFNAAKGGVVEPYVMRLGYDHMVVEDVLRKILPPGTEVPSSFEQIGHIAHMNLKEEVHDYRFIIGAVVLDKNPTLKTVVNKLGSIETEFRTFPMEVLAGENLMDVTVKESGAKFQFNFADVYWNSRLSTEHGRLVNMITGWSSSQRAYDESEGRRRTHATTAATATGTTTGTTVATTGTTPTPGKVLVADLMGGVGPFAVPLALSGQCEVHANGE
jgi:tRNA (guanine37-N1)-methyltransferase